METTSGGILESIDWNSVHLLYIDQHWTWGCRYAKNIRIPSAKELRAETGIVIDMVLFETRYGGRIRQSGTGRIHAYYDSVTGILDVFFGSSVNRRLPHTFVIRNQVKNRTPPKEAGVWKCTKKTILRVEVTLERG